MVESISAVGAVLEDIQRHAPSYGKTFMASVPHKGVWDLPQTRTGHIPVFVDHTEEGTASLRSQNGSSMCNQGTLFQYRDRYQGANNGTSNVDIALVGAHSMLVACTE